MTIIHRRNFIAGLVSALAAPAIVHAGNLMPIRGDKLIPVGFGYGRPSIWWVVKYWTDNKGVARAKYVPAFPGDPLYDRCEELHLVGKIAKFSANGELLIRNKPEMVPLVAEFREFCSFEEAIADRPFAFGRTSESSLDKVYPLVKEN